jgi:hypothetical protein
MLKMAFLKKCVSPFSPTVYSFICDIKGQTLKLKAAFHPSRQASIEVTLEEIAERVDNSPIP